MPDDTNDRKERLRSLESSIRRSRRKWWLYRWMHCRDCGKREDRGHRAKRCKECQEKHAREQRTEAQRNRRAEDSPLFAWKDVGPFRMLMPAPVKCQQCGKGFEAKRKTARFCSTKCRMAAHRTAGQVETQAEEVNHIMEATRDGDTNLDSVV